MNLLFSNDARGEYPPSWYAATATPLPRFAPLKGRTSAYVCIIGAGYTGVSAALHLAQLGYDCVVIDAQRIGFGASGRNGGQLGMGQRMDQRDLIRLIGDQSADLLWTMGVAAQNLVKDLIAKHDIDCHLKPGVAYLGNSAKDGTDLRSYAAFLNERYDATQIRALDRDEGFALCPTGAYHGGLIDDDAAHLHPLQFVLGLAKAAADLGVRFYEQTYAHDVTAGHTTTVRTDQGHITAKHVIYAGNGYMGNLQRKAASRIMPINNFIAATEPLGDRVADVLTQDIAVADSKFVVNYFRLSHDGRLLFGGGENYGYRFPADIAATVHKPMTEIFPNLKDVRIDYAWGGTLGITMRRMPFFARLSDTEWTATGYSGHGVGTATQAGHLMAQAIHGDSAGFDAMATVPALPFPGGSIAKTPLLVLAMTWYSLRDRFGV